MLSRLVFWTGLAHDQPDVQALHNPANCDVYDGIALVSHWQLEQFHQHFGIEQARTCVLHNAIAIEAELRRQVDYVNRSYTWSVRTQEWIQWLSNLGNQSAMVAQPTPLASSAASQVEQSLNQAAQYGQAGRFAEAAAICEQILQQQPENARAWHLLGLSAFRSGKGQDALSCLSKAIALDPNTAEFHNHLGVVYCSLGELEQGVACYQQALTLQPQLLDTHYNLALALHKQGNLEAAIRHYQQVIALNPRHAQAHHNLGNALQQQQQFDIAIAHYQQALAVRPAHAETWYKLGAAQQARGELEEAAKAYQQALAVNPTFVEAHNNLGCVLQEQGKAQQAIAHYQQALALRANFPNALINLGNILLRLERFAEAQAAYRQLLSEDPDNLQALDGLVKLLRQTCEWTDVEAFSNRLMAIAESRIAQGIPCEVMPLNTLLLPFSPAQQQAIAVSHATAIAESVAECRQQLGFSFNSHEERTRLRLGYVSGDFREHAVAHLILRLFGFHDREAFEVFAYSLGPNDGSNYRQQIARDCDRFTDISNLTPTASARQVFNDGIDILVDLAGYTEYSSPRLFALRPAPIQVNYLGYPGTLGADFIDYIITDKVVTPKEQAEFFSEQCVYLPDCYQINDNQQDFSREVPAKNTYGLPENAFVYCCFNNNRKISPQIFATWMRILRQVPDSVLWLFSSYPEAQKNLLQSAQSYGISAERLIFAQRLPKTAHLHRLQCADLFLDTLFYNAHTTASDALWAGVPVLTLPGETFASRVATSLLSAIGLPEPIAQNLAEYESLAVGLAQRPQDLHRLKAKLAENRQIMPLYDTLRSVRHLEQAYWMIWQVYQSVKRG